MIANQVFPPSLPIIPLPVRPIFPRMVLPLQVEAGRVRKLVEDMRERSSNLVGLVLSRSHGDSMSSAEAAAADDDELYAVGVVAQILKAQLDQTTGHIHLVLGGMERFRVRQIVGRDPYLIAEVEYLYEKPTKVDESLKAHSLAVVNLIRDLVKLNPLFKEELNLLIGQSNLEEPGRLADMAAFLTSSGGAELQDVLETLDARARLEKVLLLLNKELDISRLQTKIRQEIEERVTKQQREHFLREQLKAIKRELGLEKDDKAEEIERFRKRLEGQELPAEAKERIDDELTKLSMLETASPEFNVTRNYIDWLTALPWDIERKDPVRLEEARHVLAEHHHGLEDVKERILEFIAAGILRGDFAGSIICLVGPPGVGKTSIGRSIAEALKREFYRFSLGGMRDEAEIKGHRRTYIGAMPGKFIQAMRVCRSRNPLIMLDEIDKLGASYQGDPASALLEVLDPAQNRDFLDHYLDVRFDLSRVLFVCTANQLDTIPGPLLDRMEIIKLSGYLVEEKLMIARRFILPRELEVHHLTREQLSISLPALRFVIEGYARDAGVRRLEQLIKKLVRKAAVRIVEYGETGLKVGPKEVEAWLGRRVFSEERLHARPLPGVVTGLAWTSMGGDTLVVEATAVKSKSPGLKQTGQLGKVMVESSEIAYTYARQAAESDPDCARFFDEHLIHLHVPAGATPKDGPSAGATIALALYTLARNVTVRPRLAMTGELELKGRVLPVGGIREKLVAAKRARIKHVILPADNRAECEELPEYVKVGLVVHFVSSFEEVLAASLPKPS